MTMTKNKMHRCADISTFEDRCFFNLKTKTYPKHQMHVNYLKLTHLPVVPLLRLYKKARGLVMQVCDLKMPQKMDKVKNIIYLRQNLKQK